MTSTLYPDAIHLYVGTVITSRRKYSFCKRKKFMEVIKDDETSLGKAATLAKTLVTPCRGFAISYFSNVHACP